MNKFIIALGLSATSLLCLAGERVDNTLEAKADGRVNIEHLSGKAVIRTWDRNEVRVSGELDDRAEELVFKRRGDEIIIHVRMPKINWGSWGKDDGDDLEIHVPRGSFVEYETVNADLDASGFTGGAELSSVNGELRVTDLKGRLLIDTVNGRIRAENLQGDIKLSSVNGEIEDEGSSGEEIRYDSVNGDIRASTSIGRVRMETVNSDAELKLAKVEKLTLETVNGDTEVWLDLQEQGEVSASNVSGNLELHFATMPSARFDIEGHAGGSFTNRLSDDKASKAKYGPSRWLKFSTGSGAALVNVSTVSGRVLLDKD